MTTPTLTASMSAALAELNLDASALEAAFGNNPGSLFNPSPALQVAEQKFLADLAFDLTHVDSKGNVAASGVDLVTVSANHFASYAKAGLVVATLGAQNNLGTEAATYTIAGGADKAGFAIVNGQLVTTKAFDWHAQSVADVQVKATDASGRSYTQDFKFTLDHNAPPVTNPDHPLTETLSSSHVAEFAAAGTVVGNLSATDSNGAETFTYAVTGGDTKDFAVVNGNLVTTGPISHASSPSEQVTVTVTDHSGASLAQSFTVATDQVFFAPTAVTLAQAAAAAVASAPAGTVVGTLAAADAATPASDTFTYAVTGGANAADFAVSGNHLVSTGQLSGTGATETVVVTATESHGLSFSQSVQVAVDHGPGAVSLSSAAVLEETAAPTVVGTLSSAGALPVAYTVVGGADAASFAVDQAGHLVANHAFDQTVQHSADVVVRATDSLGATQDTDLAVQIQAAPITGLSIDHSTVNEHLSAGTIVGTLSAADANQHHSFTYAVTGGDTADFSASGNHLVTNGALSWVQAQSHGVTVQVTDETGHSFQQALTVGVNEVYVAPTDIALSSTHVADGTAAGAAVASLSALGLEPGDHSSFAIVGGAGAANFTVQGNELVAAHDISYAQSGGSLQLQLAATEDNGLSFSKAVTLSVDAPTPNGFHDIFLSSYTALANQAPGEIVGQLSTDDNQATTWHVVGGADAAEFAIDANSNLVTTDSLSTFSSLSRDVIVAGQDATGTVFSQDLSITVQPVSNHVGSGPVTAVGGIYADIFQPQGGALDITGFAEANNDQINLSSYLSPAQVDTSHVRLTGTNDSHVEMDVNNGGGWKAVAFLENAQSNDYTLSGGFGQAVSQPQLDSLTSEWIASHVVHA